jgi:superfamily II DNA or RNA helicase
MIKLNYFNEAHIQIVCEFDEAQDIADLFSFYAPNYNWSPKYNSGVWDGKIKLFNVNNCLLPFGLLPKFIGYCKLNDWDYDLDERLTSVGDKVTETEILDFCKNVLKTTRNTDNGPVEIIPYDYQVSAVKYFMYHRKMIGVSATASGKSFIYYIFFNLLMYIYPEFKGLLIVPRTSLVEQMAGDFQEYAQSYCDFEPYIHKIHSGAEKYSDKKIIISTWQSLANMPPEYFEPFHAVIVDEVHEATAKELPRITNHCVNATYRVGMTGHLKDCKIASIQLTALLGKVKTFSKSADLIKRGILAGIDIKGIVLQYDENIRKQFKGKEKVEWQNEVKIIQSIPARKKFLCQLAATRKGNTMVLFKVRDYGRELHRLIKKNYPNKHVYYIDGTVKTNYREKVRKVTEKHEDIIIVASYGTFSTGINIKNLHNLVFAESVLSSVKVIQSIGRLLRKYFNKNAKLYDIADDLCWKSKRNHVLKHFLRRTRYYDEEQFDYTVTNKKI